MEAQRIEVEVDNKRKQDDKTLVVRPAAAARARFSKEYRIKGVTRSIVVDALAVLDDMWEECQEPPSLRENCYLLYKYLGYLKRFCEERT